jgi:hypothetical protein
MTLRDDFVGGWAPAFAGETGGGRGPMVGYFNAYGVKPGATKLLF